MPKFISIILFVLVSATAVAEDYIARFADNNNTKAVVSQLQSVGAQSVEVVVPSLNIYTLKSTSDIRARLANDPNIIWIQKDHPLTLRRAPSDPSYEAQWGVSNDNTGIGAAGAWELGTGGEDIEDSKIVVAVVDDGMDITHEDLRSNIWINRGEIPGNGIDDDRNGFVDDVNGWNFYDNNNKLPKSSHGTHVGGIVGAQGDNSRHGTGVNWNIEIMPLAASTSRTSIVLAAYGYVVQQKRLWLETDGRRGANVVATNSSFGVDRGDCTSNDYPAWNDIYNEMGEVGILSAVAAPNWNWDIDQVGDVPSGCSSEYIVGVTNNTVQGRKAKSAGYGKTHIDLAAPGERVLSTVPGNKLSYLSGTSMATPHVSGSIAFLHSVASKDFALFHRSSPGKAALALKKLILDNTSEQSDLRRRSVSGGRLNLDQAAQQARRYRNPFWSIQLNNIRESELFQQLKEMAFK